MILPLTISPLLGLISKAIQRNVNAILTQTKQTHRAAFNRSLKAWRPDRNSSGAMLKGGLPAIKSNVFTF